jgi:hypothetical protein
MPESPAGRNGAPRILVRRRQRRRRRCWSALSRQRATKPGSRTCGFAVTDYGQESVHWKTREAGFRHHLVKPLDVAAIEAAAAFAGRQED